MASFMFSRQRKASGSYLRQWINKVKLEEPTWCLSDEECCVPARSDINTDILKWNRLAVNTETSFDNDEQFSTIPKHVWTNRLPHNTRDTYHNIPLGQWKFDPPVANRFHSNVLTWHRRELQTPHVCLSSCFWLHTGSGQVIKACFATLTRFSLTKARTKSKTWRAKRQHTRKNK